jgi:glycosyltransferase involved in cell wall biosynthesis
MRIAMLAPPWIPVPPPGYGGIESVVGLLCEALVARGAEVELFCAPGSRSTATVRPLLAGAHPDRIEHAIFEADHVARAFAAIDAAAPPFDIVHDHCGFTALAMADRLATPLVHTVHGPFDGDAAAFYAHHAAKAALVCLSHTQAQSAPLGVDVAAVVPNPIDAAVWPPLRAKRGYLLWIGRMHPFKGPHRAIAVARSAGRPLVLAGPVQPGFEEFYSACVAPHVDGEDVVYVGEVGGARKHELFAGAHALLMPIRWPEPFGMVMVEALAAGTPVIAFASGAAPEIVDHGETGFLVDDENEMAAVVEAAGELDPACCRARVAERWTPNAVAAAYESVYRRASRAAPAGIIAPAA